MFPTVYGLSSLPTAYCLLPTASILWPLKLDYFSGLTAFLIFLGLSLFFVSLGVWSLAGLGPVRKWVAIAVRCLVALCFVLILGGARWQRRHKDVETIVCSDISASVDQFTAYQGDSYDAARDKWLAAVADRKYMQKDD